MEPKLYNLNKVIELTDLSKSTIYRRGSEGSFPKQVQLSKRRVCWRVEEIHNWLASLPPSTISRMVKSGELPKRFMLLLTRRRLRERLPL